MATQSSPPPTQSPDGAVTGPGPLDARSTDPSLYNEDLAPVPPGKRTWGAFEIFNVWSNDIQSLFGYTLAATLFISYGLNGWAVFSGILLAGLVVMWLCNLVGKPSVKYGVPYPVMARASMGVRGALFPASVRAVVAIFWYGVQTYFASTAVALLLVAVLGADSGPTFLGMSAIGWTSYLVVAVFQLGLFLRGIDGIATFLNWAGPLVYAVMVFLALAIWHEAGNGLLAQLGSVFAGSGSYDGGPVAAFVAVVGTMIAYFAAVVINYGDFSRFVRSDRAMRRGNLWGLPISLAFFSFLALFITAGSAVLYGDLLTNPAEMVARVDNVWLTVVAALTFFAATVGINLVANFIPSAYGLANLRPSRISARTGGTITALVAFVIGGLWVSFISTIGIAAFVDTLGALLAPLYGIMVVDYYVLRRQRLNVAHLFTAEPGSDYYFDRGWNRQALAAFVLAATFSVASVWVPALTSWSGFAWLLGAALGAVLHFAFMRGRAHVSAAAH